MEKQERKKEIKQRMKDIIDHRDILNGEKYDLQRELDFMNGHYDKTWEEVYT